ncbi:OLC1v1007301C1 [Oldenlandia corymbosa var. corymbosa]|uniref:OLC1v1007301C1 n=1 Tax=Oldenlandia corymbosa var. corymbosa TaxID=529605 RepID=A0AAV1DLP4_OLDCO|nr:OLC1v1007301C1 [Oldenlandia corymbosa var. corymbosa]
MGVSAKKVVGLFLLVLVNGFQESKATDYIVGDSAGWTNTGHVDYKAWASSKKFKVGDTIVFQFNNQFHNVVRVNHTNYNACNGYDAYQSYISGNDTFVINKKGHFYFICSYFDHCQSGQKVDIRVTGNDSPPASRPTAAPPVAARPAAAPPTVSPPVASRPAASPPVAAPPAAAPPVATPPATAPSVGKPPAAAPPAATTPTTPGGSAPAPAPKSSDSSLIYSSKGLIVLSALCALFGMVW